MRHQRLVMCAVLIALTLGTQAPALASHHGGRHAIYYGPHRMGRVACIRVLQGYRISGLTKAFCRDVIAHKAVVRNDALYVAIDGWGSCRTIGSWWYVSLGGGPWELKQQVDCSYPGDEAAQVRSGTIVEVAYVTARKYGFVREGHISAERKRAR